MLLPHQTLRGLVQYLQELEWRVGPDAAVVFETTPLEVAWQIQGGPSRWVCAEAPPRLVALQGPVVTGFPRPRFAGHLARRDGHTPERHHQRREGPSSRKITKMTSQMRQPSCREINQVGYGAKRFRAACEECSYQ
eukprot:COSAG02_NODE_1214_length_13857_cov_17.738334_1_plen_136_part_00